MVDATRQAESKDARATANMDAGNAMPSLDEVRQALDVLQHAGLLIDESDVWLNPFERVPEAFLGPVTHDDEGAAVTVVRPMLRYKVRGPRVEVHEGLTEGSKVFLIATEDGGLRVVPWRPSLLREAEA